MKNKELIVDNRRLQPEHILLHIEGMATKKQSQQMFCFILFFESTKFHVSVPLYILFKKIKFCVFRLWEEPRLFREKVTYKYWFNPKKIWSRASESQNVIFPFFFVIKYCQIAELPYCSWTTAPFYHIWMGKTRSWIENFPSEPCGELIRRDPGSI